MTPNTRALLATLSPIALSAEGVFSPLTGPVATAVPVASTGALLLSSVAPDRASRAAAVIGLLGVAFAHRAALLASPMLALGSVLVGTWLAVRIFEGARAEPGARSAAGGASLGTFLFWLGYVLSGELNDAVPWLLALSLASAVGLLVWTIRDRSAGRRRVEWLACSVTSVLLPLIVLGWVPLDVVGPAALFLWWSMLRRGAGGDHGWAFVTEHPERLLVLTFAGLCVVGTLMLSLPRAVGEPLPLVDAAFTAVSAVCVTGLTVVDTPTRFSTFGHWVLLLLIQVGGLGIMTLSTMVYSWIGRRMTLRQEVAAEALLGAESRGALVTATRRILTFTFSVEAAGALLLTVAFALRGEPLGSAAFRGLFTAVSAFCNAGFALQSDNLVSYADSGLVLHTVAALIVLGGLSPVSVLAIPRLVRPRGRPRRLRYLLPLLVTALLVVVGAFLMLGLEWGRTLRGFDWIDRLNNAWFQSVTLRTAGFNSVDFAQMGAPTITLCLVFMFIGGSPGGTAGGIKTTTFALICLGVLRAVRGEQAMVAFRRTVSEASIRRAGVVFTLALVSALFAVVALQLTHTMPPEVAAFEVVSALGTVGLSIGGTARLDEIGKVIIMVCMFVGRVGGLSLLMFLSTRRSPRSMHRPEEEIDVG